MSAGAVDLTVCGTMLLSRHLVGDLTEDEWDAFFDALRAAGARIAAQEPTMAGDTLLYLEGPTIRPGVLHVAVLTRREGGRFSAEVQPAEVGG